MGPNYIIPSLDPILYAKARDYVTQIYNMGNYVG
jgi:hypothetical protein